MEVDILNVKFCTKRRTNKQYKIGWIRRLKQQHIGQSLCLLCDKRDYEKIMITRESEYILDTK